MAEGSEYCVAWAENLAASVPVTNLAELPAADVPLAVAGAPVDIHGEDFTVFALDVEDVCVAVVEEQTRLAVGLCFDKACDVFERRQVCFRQFLADIHVVGIRLEERGHVGALRSRVHRPPSVHVETICKRVVDVEAGAGLVELRRIEGLRPCRNGGLGDRLEKSCFGEQDAITSLLSEWIAPLEVCLKRLTIDVRIRIGMQPPELAHLRGRDVRPLDDNLHCHMILLAPDSPNHSGFCHGGEKLTYKPLSTMAKHFLFKERQYIIRFFSYLVNSTPPCYERISSEKKNMTIKELQKRFFTSPISVRIAPEDFFILLSHVAQKTREYLIAHPEYTLSPEDIQIFSSLAHRRLTHEPIAYLTGHKEFYGLDFMVTRATLIPRPETELVIELVLNEISNFNPPAGGQISQKIALIDIGTGSGNIIIALAQEIEKTYPVSDIQYHAIDISSKALNIAQHNAKIHHVDHLITFHQGNLLHPLDSIILSFDEVLIVANLPYLSQEIYGSCAPDVKDYEPSSALVSDEHGLAHILSLLKHIVALKKNQPSLPFTLWLEISPEQEPLLSEKIPVLFPQASFVFHRDFAKKYRFVRIRT